MEKDKTMSAEELARQLEDERNYQNLFHEMMIQVYGQKLKPEELAQKIIETIIENTGVQRAGIFLCDNGHIKMMAHHCETPCEYCTLLRLRDRIDHPQTFSISMLEGQNTNSFYVNDRDIIRELYLPEEETASLKTNCNIKVYSYLTARSYQKDNNYADLILLNAPDGFKDSQLTWMERFISVFTLVRQQEEMKKAVFTAQNDVVEAGKAKAQFLANVSHEIRSPLNGVICMASLLKETPLDEEQQELLNIIQFSAENITRIIQDLLDLTQISTGKMVIRMESFSVKDLVTKLLQNFHQEFEKRGLEFQYSLDEKLDTFIGDRVRISQIISNLVNNALKYTEKGRVFLEIRKEDDYLVVVISDTGLGIPEDKLSSIFDQFVQLHSADKKKSGVGLGLAIVKELVELMGGTIDVRSKVNRGSSFTIKIPTGGREISMDSPEVQDHIPRDNSSIRILVAEDDQINSLYLKTFLRKRGFQVDDAANGSLAVNLCRMNQYHLVLMDVSMPVMDGLEATRNIRQFAPKMEIIAVTAHAYEEDQRKIRQSGMNDIVLKPIDEQDLMKAIEKALKRT